MRCKNIRVKHSSHVQVCRPKARESYWRAIGWTTGAMALMREGFLQHVLTVAYGVDSAISGAFRLLPAAKSQKPNTAKHCLLASLAPLPHLSSLNK